jgi:hypothetical protein
MKLDFEKVGNAVGALQGSTLDGVGSAVLDIVVSGDLGDNDMIGSAVAGIKNAYDNGTPIADAVKTTGDIIKVVDSLNKGDENLAESFEDLVEGLTEATLDLLPDVIKTDVLVSFGIPKEYADSAFGVIETLLRELLKLQGAEDYNNEVDAILSLYNFATTGLEDFKEEDIPGIVEYAIKSDAIYNTLNSVSTSNPFGIEITNEADREAVADAIEKYYAEDKASEADKQRVYDVYSAIARLLGVENEVELAK